MDASQMTDEELRAAAYARNPKFARLMFDDTPTVEEQRATNRRAFRRAHAIASGGDKTVAYRRRFAAGIPAAHGERKQRDREMRYFQQIRASWGAK